MRSFNYISTVLATALALVATTSAEPAGASPRGCSSSSAVASTSNYPSTTSAPSNTKLRLSRDATTKVSLNPVRKPLATGRSSASVRKPLTRIDITKATSTAKSTSTQKTTSTKKSSTKSSSSASSTPTSSSPYTQRGDKLDSFYFGANSYYLYALPHADRIAVLDAMKGAGLSVVRVFITHVYYNNKGSGNEEIPDLEQNGLGDYDDTILELIDQLMLECYERNIKLIIACGDRYALGFWDTDQYAYAYGIVDGGSGAQKVSDASTFYTSNSAMTYFDHRIDHIMAHKNKKMSNLPWSQLDSVIYAMEPQNEPQGHMDLASSSWSCDRAGRIKQNLPSNSNILVTSGGGITISTSLASWAFDCPNIDVISVHDYGTDPSSTIPALQAGQQKAWNNGQTLLFEEWGALGGSKSSIIQSMAYALRDAGIPWLYWEIVKPGKGSSDFEVWTDEDTWWNAIGNGDVTGAINWGSDRSASSKVKRHASAPQVEGTPASNSIKLGRRRAESDNIKRHATIQRRRQMNRLDASRIDS